MCTELYSKYVQSDVDLAAIQLSDPDQVSQ